MLVGSTPPRGRGRAWQRQIKVPDGDGKQIEGDYGDVRGRLRLLVFDFDAAATALCHFAALAMHHLAAGAIRWRHLLRSDTRHHRRCCEQQEQDCNETGQATRHV